MKTVLITGANKGIGFESARQFLNLNYNVILTARNKTKGIDAVNKLAESKSNISFLQMDVSDEHSVESAANELKEKNLKIDVLVNNAAILIHNDNINKADSETILSTFKTNTLGPILVIKNFLSIINNGGRIINVSSSLGSLELMSNYAPSYSISKAALNAVTKQYSISLADRKISINSMGPGWVRTDMGGSNAERSVEKGAETIIWLADEAPQNITGKYFHDKKQIDW